MATAAEIIALVNAGETVRIPSRYVNTFMQQCEAHGLNCSIYMTPEPGRIHALSLTRPAPPAVR